MQLRANGKAMIFSPDMPYVEQETLTCAHCQKVVFIQPGGNLQDIGGICKRCREFICEGCCDKGICEPWVER